MKLTDRLSDAARVVAEQIPDATLVAGAAAVSYGVWQIYVPAGWIVGGMLLLAGGWLLARGSR